MRVSKMGRVSKTGLIAAFAAGAMALVGSTARAQNLTEVVMGTPTNLSLNYSMFTAAMELGYFEQEGLKVRLQEFQGGAIVMTQVGTKSIQFGSGTADPLIIASQPGKPRLPIKFFFNQTRDYNWEFVVPDSSPIKTIADLKGKKVGVGALTNSHMPVSRVIMKENGLEVNKDYSFVAIGVGGPAFKALTDGQVDAYNSFTANIATYETLPGAVKLRRLEIGQRYKSLFQNSIFAHEDTFRDNPKLLVGFARAVAKATVFCNANMEFCIQTFWRYYINLKPRDGSDEENVRRFMPSMVAAWKSNMAFPAGEPRKFGAFPKGSWENNVEILFEGGELAAKYDPSSLYTNDIADKINDFDVAAIEKAAKEKK